MRVVYHGDDLEMSGSRARPRLAMSQPCRKPGRARWGLLFALAASAGMWAIVIAVAVKLAARL